jgi:hypothetical protein
MLTQTPLPTDTTKLGKPGRPALRQITTIIYVAAQMVLSVALGIALVAIGQRSESLAPAMSWLLSEPLRPLGIVLLALGLSMVADALSPRVESPSDADATD